MGTQSGIFATKYLVRVWPSNSEPPEFQQSEMCSPEAGADGLDGNDRAEIRAVRNWAQGNANVENIQYSFEVCRDSMVAALAGSGGTRRQVATIARGTVAPGGQIERG